MTASTFCYTVRRRTRAWGTGGSPRQGGRHPAVSSSYSSKNTASSLELTVFWLRKATFVSGPAPLNAEWCRAAANSIRTVIRSCRSHERSRRSLLRRAEPTSRSAMSKPTVKVLEMWLTTKEYTRAKTLVVDVIVVELLSLSLLLSCCCWERTCVTCALTQGGLHTSCGIALTVPTRRVDCYRWVVQWPMHSGFKGSE